MQSENAASEISLNYSSVQSHCLTENLSRNFFECLYIASSVKRMHVLMVDVIFTDWNNTKMLAGTAADTNVRNGTVHGCVKRV